MASVASSTAAGSTSGLRSYVARPPQYIFNWPADVNIPKGPPHGALFSSSFDLFMDVRVPIAIATVYASAVHFANHLRKTNKEPIAFAKTNFFKFLVVLHNVALCIYSAWTCIGMSSAIYKSVFAAAKLGVSGSAVDAYLNGEQSSPFLPNGGFWRSLCDVNEGIWENGLSYYGFFFYLSKFYEVVDTMIILAKGKQSSLLQTYHHAGAMLSMWAGIRYASPPIWIFVVFNSLIHTIMYFYYTLSALKIQVPKVLKRALTTAQICQFIFGGTFALLHVFVYYFNPSTGNYTSCMANPGQSFAVMFNVGYLAPLTYLFVNFWIKSYKGMSKRKALAEKKKSQ